MDMEGRFLRAVVVAAALVLGGCTDMDVTECEVVVPNASKPDPVQVMAKIENSVREFARTGGYECWRGLDGKGLTCFGQQEKVDFGMTSRSRTIQFYPSTLKDDKDVGRITMRFEFLYTSVSPWKSSGETFDAASARFVALVQSAGAPSKPQCTVGKRP